MSSPPPQKQSQTILGTITQAVHTLPAKIVNFSKLVLKKNARVPKLLVKEADAKRPEVYPLLGDRFILGRSSKSCDIVIRNPVVSQVHLSLERNSKRRTPFTLKDENSTNGIYRGKQRITKTKLRHNDRFTLGPPELQAAVTIKYADPPPWYVRGARYTLYGIGGIAVIATSWLLVEWRKVGPVYPLPRSVQGPVIVYARDAETPLVPPRNNAHIELAKLSDFSAYLPKAVVASEDSRFYWHPGIDPIGIVRALVVNLQGGTIREGASTITQQLARSLFRDYVGTSDTAARKIREIVVALKLELVYSKKDLMQAYLNRVYLGSGNYGFEDAAQFYFGKSARNLDLSEAATLVGILPAPNSFNPVRDYQRAALQRDGVIYRMVSLSMISQEEADRARRSRIEVSPKAIQEFQSTIAPYYYDYVFSELETLLPTVAREGNFIIETGLDPKMQTHSETALRDTVNNAGSTLGFDQGAVVTIDASSGVILALNGGVDYQQSQFNRATQALRQPGSTFKVFAYTAAIAQNISPRKTYSCAPFNWGGVRYGACQRSGGNIDMYTGLALSENAVALRVAQNVGLDKVVQMAQRMGIRSDLNPVPGLILGQSEVTPLEMTGAYAVLANRGVGNRPHAIKRILDSSDCDDLNNLRTCRVIYDYNREAEANLRVMPPSIADTMTAMLQGVVVGGTGSSAYIGRGEEAGKTGTTNDNVDLWFIGYLPSRNLVTGIWLGNDDNSPTNGSSAHAAQLWGNYMRQVLR